MRSCKHQLACFSLLGALNYPSLGLQSSKAGAITFIQCGSEHLSQEGRPGLKIYFFQYGGPLKQSATSFQLIYYGQENHTEHMYHQLNSFLIQDGSPFKHVAPPFQECHIRCQENYKHIIWAITLNMFKICSSNMVVID